MLKFKNYVDHQIINDALFTIKSSVKAFDWRELGNLLRLEEKDFSSFLFSWFSLKTDDSGSYFESSGSFPELDQTNCSLPSSELLSIDLQLLDAPQFKELKELVNNIKGVDYAGFMFMSPGSHIPAHNDGEVNSIIITLNIEENNADAFLRINKDHYYFSKSEIFTFDASIPHEAKNLSKTDWIMFVLRIEKEYFTKEEY
jgi:hypothetical protein